MPTHVHGAITAREREILGMIAAGLATEEIADRLQLSRFTVKAHRANAYTRLGAKNAPHAIALAVTRGELDLAVVMAAALLAGAA